MMNALSRDSLGGNAIVEELLMPSKPIPTPGSLSTGSINPKQGTAAWKAAEEC
jgi:hypothetical protein